MQLPFADCMTEESIVYLSPALPRSAYLFLFHSICYASHSQSAALSVAHLCRKLHLATVAAAAVAAVVSCSCNRGNVAINSLMDLLLPAALLTIKNGHEMRF